MDQDITTRLEKVVDELTKVTEGIERSVYERDSDILISCNEAARHLGKTPATVSAMVRDGRLERVTIDGSTGIRLSEIWKIKAS